MLWWACLFCILTLPIFAYLPDRLLGGADSSMGVEGTSSLMACVLVPYLMPLSYLPPHQDVPQYPSLMPLQVALPCRTSGISPRHLAGHFLRARACAMPQ